MYKPIFQTTHLQLGLLKTLYSNLHQAHQASCLTMPSIFSGRLNKWKVSIKCLNLIKQRVRCLNESDVSAHKRCMHGWCSFLTIVGIQMYIA